MVHVGCFVIKDLGVVTPESKKIRLDLPPNLYVVDG